MTVAKTTPERTPNRPPTQAKLTPDPGPGRLPSRPLTPGSPDQHRGAQGQCVWPAGRRPCGGWRAPSVVGDARSRNSGLRGKGCGGTVWSAFLLLMAGLGHGGMASSAVFDFLSAGDGDVGWMQVTGWERLGVCLHRLQAHHLLSLGAAAFRGFSARRPGKGEVGGLSCMCSSQLAGVPHSLSPCSARRPPR